MGLFNYSSKLSDEQLRRISLSAHTKASREETILHFHLRLVHVQKYFSNKDGASQIDKNYAIR